MRKAKTIEQFIDESSIVHNNRYDYSLSKYINIKTKIEIICKHHGSFVQIPSNHLKGHGCFRCGIEAAVGNKKAQPKKAKSKKGLNIKKRTEDFINEANKKHNNKFDYSKTEYMNEKTRIIIICPIHGEISQTPRVHKKSKYGCPSCYNEMQSKDKSYSFEQFIEKALKKHNGFYSYEETNYIKMTENIAITCPTHGSFEQKVKRHLEGSGCKKCSNIKTTLSKYKTEEDFIVEATNTHNGKYTYGNAIYKHSREKVIITCPNHGDFKQRPDQHIQGAGCKKCGNIGKGGYGKTKYINRAKGRKCIFYILKCWNEEEEFYKIGITMNSVEQRYKSPSGMPYNYKIVSEVCGEAGFIWDLENREKKKLRSLMYIPKIGFGGSMTECFNNYTK